MKMFDEKGIPSYRRILAAEFIKHPMNTEDSAKVLEEELQWWLLDNESRML